MATSLSMQFYIRNGQLIDSHTLLRAGTPLPVALTTLQARQEGAAVHISWTTAQELRCRGFGVEVSTDGLGYRKIGVLPGAGSSSTPRQYAFRDVAPGLAGLRYYRLRQEDEQGPPTYFGPVPVPVEAGPVGLSTYPNPFAQELTVDVTVPAAAPVTLTLTDDQGRVVWQATQAAQAGLNHLKLAPQLPPGLYQATVRVGGRRLQQRLAKL